MLMEISSILWGEEVMFSGSAGLSVCFGLQHYSKSYKRIAMKFYGWVQGGKRNN